MFKNITLIIIFVTLGLSNRLYGAIPNYPNNIYSSIHVHDTIEEKQALYNGQIWSNNYHRIEGDQFLFSWLFIPATISMSGKTYKNVRIKYDIYSDEIITPLSSDIILQLNKELVDSFTISFEDREYRFINIRDDTLKGTKGYVNVLYKGNSVFYTKYKKSISPATSSQNDGNFSQSHNMYLMKNNIIYPISSTKSLYKAFKEDQEKIKNFIKTNKLKVTKKMPESFIPVLRFYDNSILQIN